jgi:hypothetical protein
MMRLERRTIRQRKEVETMRNLVGLVILVGLVSGGVSCGGSSSSSSDTTTYPVTASVALPAAASISSPFKSVSPFKAITETAAVGVEVQAKDAAGNEVGSPCITAADGTCTIDLTAEELEAGVVFESENMHAYRLYDATDIALIAAAPLTAPVGATEDVVYALTAAACGGDLAACPSTVDPGCLTNAMKALPDNDPANTSAIDGYIEGLVSMQGNAFARGAEDATDALIAAFRGSPAGFVSAVGSDTVSDVPVTDAVTNGALVSSTIQSAYCTRDGTTGVSPWETARAAAPTTDIGTFGKAMAGPFEFFTPSELQGGLYEPEDFRGFMTAGPQLDGFFEKVGGSGNDLARRAFTEGFRQEMFADPTRAPMAVGFLGATFPTAVGGVIPWTGNAYDPTTASQAGRNAFMDLTGSGSFNPASYTPNMINSGFQPMMGDPTHRNSFANGGGSEFVGSFMGDPAGFVPANFVGQMQSPPGGSCTTSENCLPCDNCLNSICVAGSSKMGSVCLTDSDCDAITLCIGPPNAAFASVAGRNCMCASVVPTGLGVYTGGGAPPQPFNPAGGGGYVPPPNGNPGGACGIAMPCIAGYSCTDALSGVCVPAGFRYPAGHSCGTGADCVSNICTSSVCIAGGGETVGIRANGQPCAFPNECQSMMCMAGICSPMGGSPGDLKPDGSTCTTGDQCGSHYCGPSGICMQQGGLPAGQPCTYAMACQSMACNFATGLCF